MKRIILMLTVLMFSCSQENSLDPIIGRWNFESVTENGVDISIPCDNNRYVVFKENGDVKIVMWGLNYENDVTVCEFKSDEVHKWKNTGNNTYLIKSNDEEETSKFELSGNRIIVKEIIQSGESDNVKSILTFKKE